MKSSEKKTTKTLDIEIVYESSEIHSILRRFQDPHYLTGAFETSHKLMG